MFNSYERAKELINQFGLTSKFPHASDHTVFAAISSALSQAVEAECERILTIATAFAERTPKCCPECGVGQSIEQLIAAIRTQTEQP